MDRLAEERARAYARFLHDKSQDGGEYGFEPLWLPDWLFPFQAHLLEWGMRKGRPGVFADCGLGKSPMQLAWAENVHRKTGKPVLIVAPLAVTFQTLGEAEKFGIDAAVSRDGRMTAGVTLTNYDMLHHFLPVIQSGTVEGMACDESSAIKSFDSERRDLVTMMMRKLPYRSLWTATAAPNDFTELGTSSEALGYLGYMDMLSRFFTNRDLTSKQRRSKHMTAADIEAGGWRFKGHAEDPFWRWVASWARAMRKPSDLGFSDDGFIRPPVVYRQHVVDATRPPEERLFDVVAAGLREEREEARRTLHDRCEKAADLLADADHAVAWCNLNPEGDLLTHLIDGAVQVTGADPPEAKEAALLAFSRGEIRVLVTKGSIGAWGMNWQHCCRTTIFPTHSYEQFYQEVRRFDRFGQRREVIVDIVTTEGGRKALSNLQRKAKAADRMHDALVAHMADAQGVASGETYDQDVRVPAWMS